MKRWEWTYRGTRYTMESDGALLMLALIIFMAVADMIKSPWDALVATGLIVGMIMWLVWTVAKAKKAEAEQKYLFNLVIDIRCHKRNFESSSPIHSVEDDIEMYGVAIRKAKKLLKGHWKVTDDGRLMRGTASDVETRNAVIDIDEVIPGLEVLRKVLAGEVRMSEKSCRVHFHYVENGGVVNIGADERGLYLN